MVLFASAVSDNSVISYENSKQKRPFCQGRSIHIRSLFGGYKVLRPEFIPIYQICTPLDRLDCGYEAKINYYTPNAYNILPINNPKK